MLPSSEPLFLYIAAPLSLSLALTKPNGCSLLIENHNNKEACVLDSVLYEFHKLI
jgi:hypothetical protein